jgi:hypothetical protein
MFVTNLLFRDTESPNAEGHVGPVSSATRKDSSLPDPPLKQHHNIAHFYSLKTMRAAKDLGWHLNYHESMGSIQSFFSP